MPLTRDTQTPPQVHYWQPKQYLWLSIVLAVLLFLALVCTAELAARQEYLHDQSLQQEHLADKANQVRALLEYELNSTLHLATGLVSYIQSKHGVLVLPEIDPWLSNMQERAHYMRNIGIAPNNTITYIYPLAGNEAALGLHYPDNKEQWPAIQKVIFSKRSLLAGPIHLQQGGLGLIYRVPVFLNNEDYWGIVSTVLNFDAIYNLMHARAQLLGIKIAVKDVENNGEILFGDQDVSANAGINLSIPGRNWQMIYSQLAPGSNSVLSTLRIAGWLIALIISLLFNSFLRALAQQNKTWHELNESKYRFSQAFTSAPQGIALIDYTGAFIDFNSSLGTTLGYTRSELTTQNFFTIATSSQRERLKNIIEGIYPKPGTNHQYESALLHKSGQVINVIISLAPTHTSSYESDWIVQIIDISHRIAFEHLLQEEVRYNQSILNAVVDGILIIDTSGNIRSVNLAASVIFGYPPDQFSHQHVNQFIQDPDSGSIMRHIKYHSMNMDLNNEINHDVMGSNANGQQFPMDLQLSCIQRNHEKLFIAVVRDISERKRLDKIKHEFISTISQELHTPLTAIQDSLQLMDKGALGHISEPVEKVIRSAEQNAHKLELLIDDLVDVDKLLAGKMQLDLATQAIYPFVVQALENTADYALQQEVTIQLLGVDEQLAANIDGHRLQQILNNLLSNAIKFSPRHSLVSVKIFNENHKIRIEIIDQGVGLTAEEQTNLFQKIYQVDNPKARTTGSTDLRLAISKELISAMYGTMGVNSEPDKGSCFFIELPLISHSKKMSEYGYS
jgi:PAS domain S-box-containing protein